MTHELTTLRTALAAASRYPTTEARLLRAIIAAIDAYLAYARLQIIREHVARVNNAREGRTA